MGFIRGEEPRVESERGQPCPRVPFCAIRGQGCPRSLRQASDGFLGSAVKAHRHGRLCSRRTLTLLLKITETLVPSGPMAQYAVESKKRWKCPMGDAKWR